MDQQLLEHLFTFLSDNRKELFLEIVQHRTKSIAVVLEDIFQSHNAAAVLRSCDCFGIQDIHIIENRNKWKAHPDIEQGSSKWLTLHQYNQKERNTLDCLERLKKDGYNLVATTPHASMTIEELNTERPIALIFGTEMHGISDEVKSAADHLVKIPMYGFTESFNISVAAAVSLHALRSKMIRDNRSMDLNDEQKTEVLLSWCMSSINRSQSIVDEYHRRSKAI
jgi:tRNA (guanosine-2'-O-)-methyltransferase